MFCGEVFLMSPDPKNPSRWRKAITADRPGRQTVKESILVYVYLEKINGERR